MLTVTLHSCNNAESLKFLRFNLFQLITINFFFKSVTLVAFVSCLYILVIGPLQISKLYLLSLSG